MFGPFIQSAYEPLLVREQLRAAALMYVQRALNLKLTVNILGTNVVIPIISEVLRSEGASTVLIDMCVNRGIGGLTNLLIPAIKAIAEQYGYTSLNDLKNLDDLEVIKAIIMQNTDPRIVQRTQNIIDAGLSFGKA